SATDRSHPLNGYDASEAKAACDGQLGDCVRGNYPFHRPLGATESPINWWKSLQHMPEAFPLCLIGEKANSILSNSMPDERTGSRITFLNSDLRSRTDVMSMVEQIKVIQYYSMQDGRTTKKGRTPTHFQDYVQTLTKTGQDMKDDWTLNIDKSDIPLEPSSSEINELAARFDSSLRLFDLKSPNILDILSDRPHSGGNADKLRVTGNGGVGGKKVVRAAAADDVDWD
ncbi:hypothetical protein FRC11_010621, partial [Ceratobasidium sp. 423]